MQLAKRAVKPTIASVEPGVYECIQKHRAALAYDFSAGEKITVIGQKDEHCMCTMFPITSDRPFYIKSEIIGKHWMKVQTTLKVNKADKVQTKTAAPDHPLLEFNAIPVTQPKITARTRKEKITGSMQLKNTTLELHNESPDAQLQTTAPAAYPGNKYAADAYKRIINELPPHENFISGFLGRCAVLREKQPAPGRNVGIEINPQVITSDWHKDIEIIHADFIKEYTKGIAPAIFQNKNTLLYADPPYLLTERRNHRQLYTFELTDQQHIQLLEWMVKQKCMIAISHYPCRLYDKILKDWRKITYKINTHGGVMDESLYMNYPKPTQLHEYTWLGDNRTERQQVKRKINALIKKLNALPVLERSAIIEAVKTKIK